MKIVNDLFRLCRFAPFSHIITSLSKIKIKVENFATFIIKHRKFVNSSKGAMTYRPIDMVTYRAAQKIWKKTAQKMEENSISELRQAAS